METQKIVHLSQDIQKHDVELHGKTTGLQYPKSAVKVAS